MLYNSFQFAWEVELIVWLQQNIVNTPFALAICSFFTLFGEPMMAVLVILILYLGIDKKMAKFVAVNMFASNVINPLIKNIFFRARPYMINETVECLKPVNSNGDINDVVTQGYSFPSGHAMVSTALFGSIAVYLKKKSVAIIVAIVVTLVCLSRFALGVHYPTDVIIGAIVSGLIILIFTKLQKHYSQLSIMLVSAIIFLVGFFYCVTDDYYQNMGLYLGFILGYIFEEKFVKFENTKNIVKVIIRTIIGAVLFLAIKAILKLPFTEDFLTSRTLLSNLFLTFRYGLSAFIVMTIYPIIFKYNILKINDNNKDGI